MSQSDSRDHPFTQDYFTTGPYAEVSFARYSQYWWSNRYYAMLARRHGSLQGKVLELGCGMGHLLSWLTDQQCVYGTDINPWALSQAKRNVAHGHFAIQSADDVFAFPPAVFDIIIAKHVVEHLKHPEQAIAEMSRVLKTRGLLILVTPNLSSPMRIRKKSAWIGYKDPTHISLKFPEEWLAILRDNRLLPRKVCSDGFWDAPYISIVPTPVQKLFFGLPGGLQAILGWSIIPLRMGESLIVLAEKE
jgi:SAM-dependent methyltransferase